MTAVALVALLVLVVLNGFFVAAEFALVRSRRGKIEQLAEEGASGADAVIEQLDDLAESLAACQLGITMASIGIGFLGEPAIADADRAGCSASSRTGWRRRSPSRSPSRSRPRCTSPSASRCRRCWRSAAPRGPPAALLAPLNWFRAASAPFTCVLNKISNAMVRLIGVDPDDLEERHTAEDLKQIIDTLARSAATSTRARR